MKKLFSLLTSVLFAASLWATTDTYDFKTNGITKQSGPNAGAQTSSSSDVVFVSKDNSGGTNTTDSWTIRFLGTTCYSYGKGTGVQFGGNYSSTAYAPDAQMTSKSYSNVTQVQVITSTSNSSVSVSVKVGGENFDSKTITTGNTQTQTFSNASSMTGAITIVVYSTTQTAVKIEKIIITTVTVPTVSLSPASLTLNPIDVADQEITVSCSNFGGAISSVTTGLYSDESCETAVTSGAWVNNITVNAAKTKVTFSVANNTTNSQRQVWLKVTATDGTSTESAVLPITQKKILSTIQEIYAAAEANGTTAKEVAITFDSWVVSGVSTYNAYVTDGTKGFVFNYNNHGFTVGEILTGTAIVDLKLSGKRATISTKKSGTITQTAGGVITPTVVSISGLGGVNTGAPIIVKNVTYDGTNLVDASSNALTPHNELYADMSFTSGKAYNVTGIYKEMASGQDIMPRSAADIAEVAAVSVSPTSWDFGNVETTASVSKVFSVSGTNLEAGTLTLTAPSGYSVTPNTIEVTEATLAATEITVAKNTTTAGTYNNNLTISGCGLTPAVSVSLSMTLVAPIAVTGVSLNKTTLALETNETETLVATVAPDNATNKAVTWESDDTEVATVDANGKVTPKKAGTATITCTSVADNTKSASCEVTITEHVVTPGEYTISLTATFFGTTAGSVIASTASGTEHDVTFEIGTTSGGKPRTDDSYVRFYSNNYLDISVPSGYVMTAISFAEPSVTGDKRWDGGVSANKGTYTSASKSWSGTEAAVRFSFSDQNRIASATINYKTGTPTALDDVETSVKAVKVLRNGVLYIEKDGKVYNILGTLVK